MTGGTECGEGFAGGLSCGHLLGGLSSRSVAFWLPLSAQIWYWGHPKLCKESMTKTLYYRNKFSSDLLYISTLNFSYRNLRMDEGITLETFT